MSSRSRAGAIAASAAVAIGCGGAARSSSSSVSAAHAVVAHATAAPQATGGAAPTAPSAAAQPNASAHASVPVPRVVQDPIPFGARRKAEMTAYAARHYSSFMAPTYRLTHPRVIVIHFSETPDFQSTYNTFAPDHPDAELHELPNTCAHFVIDRNGVIHQLVPVSIMCRHTVGLNWTAIGIEHVGYSDREILETRAQMSSSLRLVRWLRCKLQIAIANVIGHNESLSSPFHREDVPALRSQTHSDFNHADMQLYRRRLRALGGCSG
jgi:N-acetylmuramoyl-L-alanine amidase